MTQKAVLLRWWRLSPSQPRFPEPVIPVWLRNGKKLDMNPITNLPAFPYAAAGQAGPVAVARRHLGGRRGLWVFAVALAAAGLFLGGVWWGFAAILPLLYVLPCAAMMAMCVKGHGGPGQNTDAKPDPASNLVGDPAIGGAGPR